MTNNMKQLIERLKELEAKSTQGEWIFNTYSAVHAADYFVKDTLDNKKWREAGYPEDDLGYPAGEWRQRLYDADCGVCCVPAIAGDTAEGRHLHDAELIAELRNAAPQLFDYIGRLEDALRAIKYNMEYLPDYKEESMEGQAKAVIAMVINNTLEGET